MMHTIRKPHQGHVFRTAKPLTRGQRDQLVACFHAEAEPSGMRLGGRRRMPEMLLDDIGRVVVKSYYRGGLIARFNRQHYFRWRAPRSDREFDWLNRVRQLGIRAPEPIATAYRGGLFCRCWLVSRAVPVATSLAQLSVERPESLDAALARCCRQIDRLIAHRILHPDLHPGNVLVDGDGETWIIDFDRARHYNGPRPRLVARYRRRWRRAVRKHGLPPVLAAMTPAGAIEGMDR